MLSYVDVIAYSWFRKLMTRIVRLLHGSFTDHALNKIKLIYDDISAIGKRVIVVEVIRTLPAGDFLEVFL